jgi:hypothetical protein
MWGSILPLAQSITALILVLPAEHQSIACKKKPRRQIESRVAGRACCRTSRGSLKIAST